MGGNALKIAKTRRYEKIEYLSLAKEVKEILLSQNLEVVINEITWFGNPAKFFRMI